MQKAVMMMWDIAFAPRTSPHMLNLGVQHGPLPADMVIGAQVCCQAGYLYGTCIPYGRAIFTQLSSLKMSFKPKVARASIRPGMLKGLRA